MKSEFGPVRSTTILAVRRNGQCAIAGDGQVTVGDMVMKHTAKKIRTLRDGTVGTGFAGSTSDAMTLFDRFEHQLDRSNGQLVRAAVEMSKDWRTDKYLRRLDAMLIVADSEHILVLSGDGDIIEPDDGIAAIGSGGGYAQAAARALMQNTAMDATSIVRASLEIASAMCIYTNNQITVTTLGEVSSDTDTLSIQEV